MVLSSPPDGRFPHRRDVLDSSEALAVSPRAGFLVVLLALFTVPASAAGLSFRYALRDLALCQGIPPGGRVLISDLNRDGDDDLVYSTPGRALCEIHVRSTQAFATLGDVTLEPGSVVLSVGDATGDGNPDLLVLAVRDNVCQVSCHDLHGSRGADWPRWTAGPYLDS